VELAMVGNRNPLGHWLTCRCTDERLTEGETMKVMESYRARVPEKHSYTLAEMTATVRSRYRKLQRLKAASASSSHEARHERISRDKSELSKLGREPTVNDRVAATALRDPSRAEQTFANEPAPLCDPLRGDVLRLDEHLQTHQAKLPKRPSDEQLNGLDGDTLAARLWRHPVAHHGATMRAFHA
jgi:hypothetical protein